MNATIRVLFALVCVSIILIESTTTTAEYTFALVPKSVDNPFFDVSRDGCQDEARILGDVKCVYVGPKTEDQDGMIQASIVMELLEKGTVNGLAISIKSVEAMTPVISRAVLGGVPVVTFDSDAPLSLRAAYIGTNNTFFGQQIGKVAKQLRPNGGKFAIISVAVAPNIVEREVGVRNELLAENNDPNNDGEIWTEVEGSPSDTQANLSLAIEQMDRFARQNVTAIIPVMGAPMRSGKWKDFVDEHRFRDIPLISGDAMMNQLQFLDRNYVHGLVGQLPYEMGSISMRVLYDLVRGVELPKEIYGTNVVSHIFVPLQLPELVVDHNLIGDLASVGYILFALVALASVACAAWTITYQKLRVVQLAQPNFLIMIAFGVLLMSTSLLPMSMDDGGSPMNHSVSRGTSICMSVPWLQAVGFTVTFSALYSKTRRVNKLFHGRAAISRVKVTEREVLAPFFVLLGANVIVLVCWTVIDPLVYVRDNHEGTDGWNRVISTYGSCRSNHVVRYLVPLGVVNLGVLCLANWQAYEARSLKSKFSESKYIAMTMASLLQAFLSGMPILFIVRKNPQAFYLTLVFMIFIISMATLLLIFVPKMISAEHFSRKTDSEQREDIKRCIQDASRQSGNISSYSQRASFRIEATQNPMNSSSSGNVSIENYNIGNYSNSNDSSRRVSSSLRGAPFSENTDSLVGFQVSQSQMASIVEASNEYDEPSSSTLS